MVILLKPNFWEIKSKPFDDEHLAKKWAKHKNFTILEDDHPTKAFIDIKSRQQVYHEIVKLKVESHDYNEDKSNNNPKVIEATDHKQIRKAFKVYFLNIYNEQHTVQPSKDDIKNFLEIDNNTSPWKIVNNRRMPKEMADSIEGDLELDEFEEGFYEHA